MATERAERRRSYRVEAHRMMACCSSDRSAGLYRVDNLSRCGALLVGGPPIPEETPICMRLLLPDSRALSVDGVVTRLDMASEARPMMAVEFSALWDETHDLIADFIADEVVKAFGVRVLIGCSSERDCKALGKAVSSIGCSPVSVLTPLDLVHQLENRETPPVALVLTTNATGLEPLVIGSFLADNYPLMRRVLVGKPCWRTRQAAEQHFHVIVSKPWTPEQLKDALDLPRRASAVP